MADFAHWWADSSKKVSRKKIDATSLGQHWVDAVEKRHGVAVFAIEGRFRPIPGWTLEPDRQAPRPTRQAS
jgi:hypothetical protein